MDAQKREKVKKKCFTKHVCECVVNCGGCFVLCKCSHNWFTIKPHFEIWLETWQFHNNITNITNDTTPKKTHANTSNSNTTSKCAKNSVRSKIKQSKRERERLRSMVQQWTVVKLGRDYFVKMIIGSFDHSLFGLVWCFTIRPTVCSLLREHWKKRGKNKLFFLLSLFLYLNRLDLDKMSYACVEVYNFLSDTPTQTFRDWP